MKELKVLVCTEKTALQSIISDVFTFGCLFGGFFINYHYLGNSAVLKIFLVVLIIMVLAKINSTTVKKMNPDKALEYLNKLKRTYN